MEEWLPWLQTSWRDSGFKGVCLGVREQPAS